VKHVTDPASDREPKAGHRPRVYPSQIERDEAMEPRYILDGRACSARRSVLSRIYEQREALVDSFFDFCKRTDREPGTMTRQVLFEVIVKWEVETFAAALYPAAHGVITFAIEVRLGFRKPPQTRRGPQENELI